VIHGWPTYSNVTWDQPMTDPAWFTIARHVSNLGNWNISFDSTSAGHQITLYKLAYETKMKMSDLLMAIVIGTIIHSFIVPAIYAYFILHTRGA